MHFCERRVARRGAGAGVRRYARMPGELVRPAPDLGQSHLSAKILPLIDMRIQLLVAHHCPYRHSPSSLMHVKFMLLLCP